MDPVFLNRKEELKFLEKKFNERGFQLIIIYGRRRIGKTELLAKFCENKEHMYFLANKRGSEHNARKFAKQVAQMFKEYPPEINNFYDAFSYLIRRVDRRRFVVVIDEFAYLVEKDEAIVSEFQEIVDVLLKKTNIMLILCGSSIGMMEKGVLSSKSPLYGRRTGTWKVTPFKIKDLFKYFSVPLEKFIYIYSIFGNLPAYFILYDKSKDIWQNVKEKILTKGEFLYNEGRILLKEELRDPETYFDVLHAMTIASKPSKIANIANVNAKDLRKYVAHLEELNIVERLWPITLKREKTKHTLYIIKDNFLDFWFRFVYPNLSYLEERRVEEVLKKIKDEINLKIRKDFEKFCKDLLIEGIVLKDFMFTKIGKQWGKVRDLPPGKNVYEIDIVALNESTKQILFAECKWQSNVNAKKITKELAEKSKYVDWCNEERKEYFAIFAKSFSKKIDEYKGRKVFCYDLRDLERIS